MQKKMKLSPKFIQERVKENDWTPFYALAISLAICLALSYKVTSEVIKLIPTPANQEIAWADRFGDNSYTLEKIDDKSAADSADNGTTEIYHAPEMPVESHRPPPYNPQFGQNHWRHRLEIY